jgi:cytochrome c oxidase subunit 3
MTSSSHTARIDDARLGLLLFLVAETMLFAGFVAVFIIFHTGALPAFKAGSLSPLTGALITAGFMISGMSMGWMVRKAVHRGNAPPALTFIPGMAALIGSGMEWASLLRYGSDPGAGPYGSIVSALAGLHVLHAVAGVIWIGVALYRPGEGAGRYNRLALCRMYWYYVTGSRVALYGMIYWL